MLLPGAIVSSVIVSLVVFPGLFRIFLLKTPYFISRKPVRISAFDEDQQENTGITVNIKVQWRYLYPGRELSYDAQSPMIINRPSIDMSAGQRGVAVVGECGAR